MKKPIAISFFLALLSFCIIRCSVSEQAVNVPIDQPAFDKLSEYHFFKGKMVALDGNEGVLPYDLITPLFTDYAEKSRFVWMPEGTAATYSKDEVLDLPIGGVLIKNFYYDHDKTNLSKGKRIIETRLLVRRADKWDALTYVWNDEQTEAFLEVAGDVKKVDWINEQGIAQTVNYVIPNKNQCKGCHDFKGELMPIGPKVRNLNKDYLYPEGSQNQLDKWASIGYLTGYNKSEEHGKVATWNDPSSGALADRALAYLEVNCGHCHRKEGPAGVSGLSLMTYETNPLSQGICKSPISAGAGTGGNSYDIVPGQPDKSILVYRMEINDPGARMPEIGRSIVHTEGVALIREWISAMEGECPESF
jgi:uncharacterized repeat protein (TIGR03806 family)